MLSSSRRPEQSGFTSGRSTVDAILAMRLLSEIHRELNKPLYVAYVDLKAAFNSVHQAALWKALQGVGVPSLSLNLIRDLHNGTGARVRVGSHLSARFNTASGVRQGCILPGPNTVLPRNGLDTGARCLQGWHKVGRQYIHQSRLRRQRSDAR
jgi:hypothetical protein